MLLHGSPAVMVSKSIGGIKGPSWPRRISPGTWIVDRTAAVFLGRIRKCGTFFLTSTCSTCSHFSHFFFQLLGWSAAEGIRVTGSMLFMLAFTHDDAFGVLTSFICFKVAFLSVPFPHLIFNLKRNSQSDEFARWQRQSESDVFLKLFFFLIALSIRDYSRRRVSWSPVRFDLVSTVALWLEYYIQTSCGC